MTVTLAREVVDVNVYEAFTMVVTGRGITHYSTAWAEGWEGDTIASALAVASIPAASVLHKGDLLDIAITGDDATAWASPIQTVLEAL